MDTYSIRQKWETRTARNYGELDEIYKIEQSVSEHPWSWKDFCNNNNQRNCFYLVALHNKNIIGFLTYEIRGKLFFIRKVATKPDYRRRRVAACLVWKLMFDMNGRREAICTIVRESELSAQFLFKFLGFSAKHVLHNHFQDTGEDGYIMEYHLPS